jgi:hypothetical protein
MRMMFPTRAMTGALICGLFASGCSQSPVAPSATLAQPGRGDAFVAPGEHVTAPGAGVSLEDVEAHGWNCRPAPTIPNLVTCTPPNQEHPVTLPGPVPDRPATFTLLVFDNGIFVGTDLLIRSDLYHGQPCRSTDGPYRPITRIGYYECLHPAAG